MMCLKAGTARTRTSAGFFGHIRESRYLSRLSSRVTAICLRLSKNSTDSAWCRRSLGYCKERFLALGWFLQGSDTRFPGGKMTAFNAHVAQRLEEYGNVGDEDGCNGTAELELPWDDLKVSFMYIQIYLENLSSTFVNLVTASCVSLPLP